MDQYIVQLVGSGAELAQVVLTLAVLDLRSRVALLERGQNVGK